MTFENGAATEPVEDTPMPQEPFIVRGHHATRLYNILATGMSIDEVMNMVETEPSPTKNYDRDVYGDTEATADTATRGIRAFFEDFMALDDDSPVRFAAGQKDGICNSCVIGKHCESNPYWDIGHLRALGRIAKNQGIEDELIEGETRLEGRTKPVPTVEMPARVARRILSDLEYHPQSLPFIVRKLARSSAKTEAARYR